MKYRIFSHQYTVDSSDYINNKKKTQILDCNCSYNTTKGSSPYYYYYNREKSCLKICQDLDATACDKAPMSILQATKSYICIDNSFNNICDKLTLFPYGFYNCESETCSTCNPIPVEDLSKNIVIANLQEAVINNVNNVTTVSNIDQSNIDQSNNIIPVITDPIATTEPIESNLLTTREINTVINNNINNIGSNSYRNIPKYTILDFFSMY